MPIPLPPIHKLRRMDFILLGLMCMLITISCVFIHGIGLQAGGGIATYWIKQIFWAGIGFVGMCAIAMIDYRTLGKNAWFILGGVCMLLVFVLVFGHTINGAKSWIKLGPFTLQPAELAKPATLLIVAWLLSVYKSKKRDILSFIPAGLACLLPFCLIMMQPDLGSAFVLIPIYASLIFVAGIRKRWIFTVIIAVTVTAFPLYKYALSDYQRDRINVFINPDEDKKGAGWNYHQSVLAVGSGGLMGKGLGNGTQYILGYLPRPVAHTDFIYSVIAEETGFVGSLILISIFVLIIFKSVHLATKAPDEFGRFLVIGFIAFLITHCYVNIGMTMGIAPIVGVPLPFVSYGGSFMLGCMGFMGILQSVHIHRLDSGESH